MNRILQITFALGMLLAASPVLAQSGNASQPLWEVHLDLARAYSSPIGKWMMEKALEDEPDVAKQIDGFVEAIGFDPRTEVHEVVVYGNSFKPADVTIVGKLGSSTGNLEGWILAAPGYRSEELDPNTLVHSFVVEHDGRNDRMWCALPKAASGNHYMFVASFEEQRVVQLAKNIRKGDAVQLPSKLQRDSIFAISVNDLSSVPLEIDDNEPGAAIVKTIESFALNLASGANTVQLALDINATSPIKAKQLSQLLTGMNAMAQLIPTDDEEAKLVFDTFQGLVVNHAEGDTHLDATLSVDIDVLRKLADH